MWKDTRIDIKRFSNYNLDVIIEVGDFLKGFNLKKSLFNKNIDLNAKKIKKFIEDMMDILGSIDVVYIKDEDFFSLTKEFCKDKNIHYLILGGKILANEKIHNEKERLLALERETEENEIREQMIKQDNIDRVRYDTAIVEDEKIKIKERERIFELKKRAEREYYGKEKTKRVVLSNEYKENIFAYFNHECTICGAKEGLHIHHKDKNPSNNQISNLLVLCGVCHKKVHMKVR